MTCYCDGYYNATKDDMKLKVAVLTTFGSWDSAYSPCNVVKHQLLSLLRHGYSPVLFTLDVFPTDYEMPGIEIRRVLPAVSFEPYHGIAVHRNVPAHIEKDIAKIVPAMEQHFKDIDVFLAHDIIFQDSFLPYNAALRKIVLNPKQRFLHWMHSGPSARLDVEPPIKFLYSLPPQSKLVYMNGYDTVRAAEMYDTTIDNVRVVHNPIDYRLQRHIHPLVDEIISHYGINDADVVCVYPLSTTRMGAGGKQLHKSIKVMSFIKSLGYDIRYIVCNAHANGVREKVAIEDMRRYAKDLGFADHELIFTSTIDKKWEGGVPHEVVNQLMMYSDVFIFPSVSENAPLVLLEAAMGKNLLVLNEDFSPMKDFVGPDALYFKFDSVTTTTSHPRGEDAYYSDVAKIIMAELKANRIYRANKTIRQKFNIDYIFKKELEPLFFEQWGDASVSAALFTEASFPVQTTVNPEGTSLSETKLVEEVEKVNKKHSWW